MSQTLVDPAQTFRLFLAVKPVGENIHALTRAARRLAELPNIRAVSSVQLHLTVKFLGDVEVLKLPALIADIRSVAASMAPFSWHPDRLLFFPREDNPRVIAAGLKTLPKGLAELVQRCEEMAIKHGIPAETKAFRPHITLGRVKGPVARERLVPFREHFLRGPSTCLQNETINIMELVRSTLTPSGPVYETLERFELGGVR